MVETPNTEIKILIKDAEDLNNILNESFDILISNLVLHLVANPLNMIKEVHRVMKPGSIGYFSILSDYDNSSVFSSFPELFKKYGYKGPNKRSVFYLSKDSALKECFPENKFDIISIETISLNMEPYETILNWNSLENFKDFVDTLDKSSKNNLIKEHSEIRQALLSKKKPFTYNMNCLLYTSPSPRD